MCGLIYFFFVWVTQTFYFSLNDHICFKETKGKPKPNEQFGDVIMTSVRNSDPESSCTIAAMDKIS